MLSPQTIQTVKSTVPLLMEKSEILTQFFYKQMFTNNPEVKPFFNVANQQAGTQSRALAGAILGYASNIDNLPALKGTVSLIAHKHASLQIKPEHYPIVGKNLLLAIKGVFGELATEEVIKAWEEAYNFLATILINTEEGIYKENEDKMGGWRDFKEFVVSKKVVESENITSFYLTPKDGTEVPSYKAGQYTTVRVKTLDDSTTMRNYSLSTAHNPNYFRISVKKEDGSPKGYVSNYLHNQVEAGATLELAPPCGEFFLKPLSRPLVLMAGGVGITPIMSMLQQATAKNNHSNITLIYASLNQKVQAFNEEIKGIKNANPNLQVYYRYSEHLQGVHDKINSSIGLVDDKFLTETIKEKDADYYFCGPKPFMVSINKTLLSWSIPKNQINFEFFGPMEDFK